MRIFGNSAKNSAKLETPARISQIDVLSCQNRAKHSECFQKNRLEIWIVIMPLEYLCGSRNILEKTKSLFVVKLHFDRAKNELSEIENLIL